MTFKEYNQNQSFLLPPSYEDFLGESHEAVVLNEFVHEMDLSRLEQSYHNQNGGRSAYHPTMLLTLLIYGYMTGTFSSRKIAKRLRQDLAYMYLSGNTAPDFRTLSRFRKEKGGCLEEIFTNVVKKAQTLGLVAFGVCSLDGTKIYANASKQKNESQAAIEEKIRSLVKQAEDIDQAEDNLYGDNEDENQNDELKTKAGRAKKKQELKDKQAKEDAKLKKIISTNPTSKESKVNTTDQESKMMQMKRKDFANGYNVQIVTENGIVLSNSIFNTSADQATLIPSIQKLQKNHQTPKVILADKGYSTESNYSFCEDNAVDAYIPTCSQSTDFTDYTYAKDEDTYTDRDGRVYRFKQNMGRRDGPAKKGRASIAEESQHVHSQYKRTIYQCIDGETKKKKYLCMSGVWQNHLKEQKDKLNTITGKDLYKRRKYDVETVFANIKKNLNFTSFNLRGFAGVMSEWTLITLAHNLKKIM